MINKIRMKLVVGYTLAIIAILVTSSIAGYIALARITVKSNEKSLLAYLETEVHEASIKLKEWQNNKNIQPNIVAFKPHKMTFSNIAYWITPEKTILTAEEIDSNIKEEIRDIVINWSNPSLQIKTISIQPEDSKRVWQFLMASKDIYDNDVYLGKVIIGTNLSPLNKISSRYLRVAILIIIIISISAFFIGNYFASKAVAPIEISMQRQKEFIGDASHEMRTPLSVMLSSIDIVEGKSDDKKIIKNIKSQILNMSDLVNNLLVLARIEDAEAKVGFTNFNLTEIIESVISSMQFVADKKNINIELSADNVDIFANEGNIKNLISILLDNAIKYSNENTSIQIKVKKHLGFIKISVEDQGIGIMEEDFDKIFNRFYRVDKARSKSRSGFGLGLSLAKKIVDLHKGKIDVESTYQKGSTFTITLPYQLDFKRIKRS